MNYYEMVSQAVTLATYQGCPAFHQTPHYGISRSVVMDGEFAFKLAFNGWGHINRAEWEFFHNLPERFQRFFAKPYFITDDDEVLVCECIPNRCTYESRIEIMHEMEEEFGEAVYFRFLNCDLHAGNIRNRSDGTPAVVDWGGFANCGCDLPATMATLRRMLHS